MLNLSHSPFRHFLSFIVLLYIILLCIYRPAPSTLHLPNHQNNHKLNPQSSGKPRIWASMGLCYSENARHNGKSNYPYKDVTPLSLLLWRYHLPEVSTIVRIVYTENKLNEMMTAYGEMLERAGAVVEWLEAGDMDCVLKSQLVRIFAGVHPLVMPDDIVMTVDVNLFVMTPDILHPIVSSPGMIAWVPQYEETASIPTGRGETFNQNLIAMKAKTWLNITGYKGNLTELVERYKRDLGLLAELGNSTWYYDQLITTHALLSSKICTVPKESGLWKMPGLKFDPSLADGATCWHGRGYRDCNKDIHIVYQGCKWWHFFPFQRMSEHIEKFYELSKNTIKLDIKVLT
eukprot:TRINITY_DN4555_c0_g1_i6.p1 TRINITY_DN4555_c0_g1~~TRINITY_DN4555_c0_g1_i6.p1  ORF type:complete len:346 (-),score=89.34 TRINITY_DN4555_c0_g1_i6:59-1096(-)